MYAEYTNSNGTLNECRFRVASVYVLNAPYVVDVPYSYAVYGDTEISAGDFVAVPFGGGNRPEIALVVSVKNADEVTEHGEENVVSAEKPAENGGSETKSLTKDNPFWSKKGGIKGKADLKPISSVFNRSFSLSAEMLEVVRFLKERTFCTVGDAVRTVTPTSVFTKLNEQITLLAPLPEMYSECSNEYKLYEFISLNKSCTKKKLSDTFGSKVASRTLATLVNENIVSVDILAGEISNIKYNVYYSASLTEGQLEELISLKKIRSQKQAEILSFLIENGKTEQSDIVRELSVTAAQLKSLTEKGFLICEHKESYRTPYLNTSIKREITLNDEQQSAADTIIALTKENAPRAALLYGVTGSGKTQVMLKVMDEVIKDGRGVILLVPEISLTPQTIKIFSERYGERTAVVHSGLSAGERFDAWRRIKRGEVDVCIGTRSAVFAPFENLGLIVMDEEQEHTYKSDSSPKYHARDVAAFRAGKHNATMLLASATPSLESYHKAVKGDYVLTELTKRYGSAAIPKTDIVDMRTEAREGNFSLFGARLVSELKENLEKGKQSVLFLNRRGYHSFMNCPMCGTVSMCPHCSVSLTHHYSRFNDKGYLLCHYCGYKSSVPTECPSCKNTKMRFMGYGTQLAEEQLSKIFPEARILRMDADTTVSKFSYDEILGKFRAGQADIMLGTQMVTKGHDFPEVTLVGMLSADQSLYLDDYRANERTFSLICQTVGRAGRRDENGHALIQCYSPDHAILDIAKRQDYKAFYQSEIGIRRALLFPPFCDMAVFTVTSVSESDGFNAINKTLDFIKERISSEYSDVKLQIFGPFEAPVYKLNEKYRVRLVIKCKNGRRTRDLFRESLKNFLSVMPKNMTLSIDINPSAL